MEDIRTHWIIMDKQRKVIGMGVPRNRCLQFLGQKDGSGRILTYKSKKLAESGFKVSGFYTHGEVGDYLLKEYDYNKRWQDEYGIWKWSRVDFQDFLEAVEVEIIIREKQ